MDEIRKNDKVKIKVNENTLIEGVVVDYTPDRIMVLIKDDFIDNASNLKELQDIMIEAKTDFGLKKMNSSVISELNKDNCIIIENCPTIQIQSGRQFVRISSDLNFVIKKNNEEISCQCDNISASGIAFFTNEEKLEIEDEVIIKFLSKDFGRNIDCNATILMKNQSRYVAKFKNLKPYDEGAIVNYVFNIMTKNK